MMIRLAATVKNYENREDTFTAVVSIEVTEKSRLVQVDHGIVGALSENLLHIEPGTYDVRLNGRGKCPFHVGQPLSAKGMN
jgi:hypothetical protein